MENGKLIKNNNMITIYVIYALLVLGFTIQEFIGNSPRHIIVLFPIIYLVNLILVPVILGKMIHDKYSDI